MEFFVRKGGRYGFSFVNGESLEGVALDHQWGKREIELRTADRDGVTRINPTHVCFMWVIDESEAEKKPVIYDGM